MKQREHPETWTSKTKVNGLNDPNIEFKTAQKAMGQLQHPERPKQLELRHATYNNLTQ